LFFSFFLSFFFFFLLFSFFNTFLFVNNSRFAHGFLLLLTLDQIVYRSTLRSLKTSAHPSSLADKNVKTVHSTLILQVSQS
jgi:hypothetical protein